MTVRVQKVADASGKISLDRDSFTLWLLELYYLLKNVSFQANQLARHSLDNLDVSEYVRRAAGTTAFVPPKEDAHLFCNIVHSSNRSSAMYGVHPSRLRNINHIITRVNQDGRSYYESLTLRTVTSQQQDKSCSHNKDGVQEVSVSAAVVPNMVGHREQDSNKSQQTRCGPTAATDRSRGRRSSPRGSRPQTAARNIKVEPPSLLVQNLLETLK